MITANDVTGFRIIISLLMLRFAVHSPANKLTGVVLFCMPLTLTVIDIRYSAVFACAVATYAAIQEGHIIRTR